ncbi:phage head morphogenesis protein [Paenibacillus kandeliae]|uniref:phage head morphogenesis protein n=1 Tax=Paenibacillus kandeliae TaxID=3231269 RepID=UPI00345A7FC0
MCDTCWSLIAKADDDEFLDSLDLTNAERAVLEELYLQGEDALIELLEQQGNEVKEAIGNMAEEHLVDEGELFKVLLAVSAGELFQAKFEQTIYDSFTPLFDLAGETELTAFDPEKVWKKESKRASAFVQQLKNLVPDMNATGIDTMLRTFKSAIETGKTPAERAQLVKEVSAQAANGEEGPFSTQRAVRISRTMTTAAANGGKQEGWMQSEVVKKKKWRAAGGKRTREDHRKANGQIVNVDEPFTVGGEKLMHPGDPAGSAKQIANCRCTTQAVLE